MRSRKGAAMFRLIVKAETLGAFDPETGRYDRHTASIEFDCDTLTQMVGLLEYMVLTTRGPLDCSILRIEEDE